MKPTVLKIARIGNSRGVRLPAPTLARYRVGDTVVMEERAEGILLRPRRSTTAKLSWEDTARAMAAESEDWTEGDRTVADGLDELRWERAGARHVAERATVRRAREYPRKRSAKK